jgi:ketosteroid isomerase-like protein
MASKNAETLRSVHESWNRRDFAGVVRNATKGLAYTDHARSLPLNTRDKFREWTEDWAKALSDGRITNPDYIDAGDVVIAQFTGGGLADNSIEVR